MNGLSAVFPAWRGSAETGFHCEGPVKRKPWRKSRIYVQEKDRLGGRGTYSLLHTKEFHTCALFQGYILL